MMQKEKCCLNSGAICPVLKNINKSLTNMLMLANEKQPFAAYYPIKTAHIIQHDKRLGSVNKSQCRRMRCAGICAAVVGTPTVPSNYTCFIVQERAGLFPAVTPDCITWITTNRITSRKFCVTLFLWCVHTQGFLPDDAEFCSNNILELMLQCTNIHKIQIETLILIIAIQAYNTCKLQLYFIPFFFFCKQSSWKRSCCCHPINMAKICSTSGCARYE